MTNVFFPEDEISTDDLYFVCYMIERVASQLKQPNKYVANMTSAYYEPSPYIARSYYAGGFV